MWRKGRDIPDRDEMSVEGRRRKEEGRRDEWTEDEKQGTGKGRWTVRKGKGGGQSVMERTFAVDARPSGHLLALSPVHLTFPFTRLYAQIVKRNGRGRRRKRRREGKDGRGNEEG